MLDWLERNQFLTLGLAGLLVLVAFVARDWGKGAPPALTIRDDFGVTPGAAIRVYVSGAVIAPGVYDLQGGDRVEDALAAAGGAAPYAALDELNLARYVRDGEQVLVPGAGSPAKIPLADGEKLDLNTASQAQLMQLKGIGEAYSRRIVDSRTVDGPYQSIDDLLTRKVLPSTTLDAIRGQLTVSTP